MLGAAPPAGGGATPPAAGGAASAAGGAASAAGGAASAAAGAASAAGGAAPPAGGAAPPAGGAAPPAGGAAPPAGIPLNQGCFCNHFKMSLNDPENVFPPQNPQYPPENFSNFNVLWADRANRVPSAVLSHTHSPMMRPMAVSARVAPAVNPVARRVVAIVAGTRIGLNMMKSGADTTNATAETASVRPAKAKKTTEATEAISSPLILQILWSCVVHNDQAAILQFDEVASPLLLEDLHTEEREAVVEVVMCMSNALRVRDWYEAPTTNKTQTERGTTGVEGMKTDRFRHSLGEREEM
ncbi:unnamed protein product [Brassica rapa subsp. narinosa]